MPRSKEIRSAREVAKRTPQSVRSRSVITPPPTQRHNKIESRRSSRRQSKRVAKRRLEETDFHPTPSKRSRALVDPSTIENANSTQEIIRVQAVNRSASESDSDSLELSEEFPIFGAVAEAKQLPLTTEDQLYSSLHRKRTCSCSCSCSYSDLPLEHGVMDNGRRKIHMLVDFDPGQLRSRTLVALLDSGAPGSFIFKSKLDDLNCRFVEKPETPYVTLSGEEVACIGTKQIFFKYFGVSTEHPLNVRVLRDPKKKPALDLLLGRDHLIPSGALTFNSEVVGNCEA